MTTFVLKTLRRCFDRYGVARTERTKKHNEDFFKYCGLLRKPKLYNFIHSFSTNIAKFWHQIIVLSGEFLLLQKKQCSREWVKFTKFWHYIYCHMNEKKIWDRNLNQLQVDLTVTSKSVMLSKTFWVAISARKSYTSNLPKK